MRSPRDNTDSVAPRERVNIVYRPICGGAQEEHELPLVLCVVGDFTCRPDPRLVESRRRVPVDRGSFTQVLAAHELALTLAVPDRLGDAPGGTREAALTFKQLDDFRPESIAAQIPALQRRVAQRAGLVALRDALARRPELSAHLTALLRDPEARARFFDALDAHALNAAREAAAPPDAPAPATAATASDPRAVLLCPRCGMRAVPQCPIDDYRHFKEGCDDSCPPPRAIPFSICTRCNWPKAPIEPPAPTSVQPPAPRPEPAPAPAPAPQPLPAGPGPDRLLRPRRPDFDDFVQLLDDLSSPSEALERATSRGWLSPEEIPRPDRGFAHGLHCARCNGTASRDRLRCDRCAGAMRLRASRAPTRVRTVAALAADPQGIRQAEALAFEALARFAQAESALMERPPRPLPTAVVWCPVEPWALGRALITEQYLVSQGYIRRYGRDFKPLLPAGLDAEVLARIHPRVQDVYMGLDSWQPPALPNPFEPLAALWELGYGQVGLSVNAVYLLLPDD